MHIYNTTILEETWDAVNRDKCHSIQLHIAFIQTRNQNALSFLYLSLIVLFVRDWRFESKLQVKLRQGGRLSWKLLVMCCDCMHTKRSVLSLMQIENTQKCRKNLLESRAGLLDIRKTRICFSMTSRSCEEESRRKNATNYTILSSAILWALAHVPYSCEKRALINFGPAWICLQWRTCAFCGMRYFSACLPLVNHSSIGEASVHHFYTGHQILQPSSVPYTGAAARPNILIWHHKVCIQQSISYSHLQ